MRISLLLKREPFGAILAETLSVFWTKQYGQLHQVEWKIGRPSNKSSNTAQHWLVNVYLNAVFVPGADEAVFDPIRREFSRSNVWWKRPLQKKYVQLALNKKISRQFAQAEIEVTPPIPNVEQKLIIAGNHKIRLLDKQHNVAYGILKTGFRTQFMQQELHARQQAVACGVPVPALLEIADDGSWFCEEFISGTPINRLVDVREGETAVKNVYTALFNLYAKTKTQRPINQYATNLQQHILTLVDDHHLLSETDKTAVRHHTTRLTKQLAHINEPITLVLTHGDFQPANILKNDDGIWLIDWEYAAQRQIGYDALVHQCATRFPDDIILRLRQFAEDGFSHPFSDTLPSQTSIARQHIAHLFMLEECFFHLTQTNQPLFTTLDSSWDSWLHAYKQWNTIQLESLVD